MTSFKQKKEFFFSTFKEINYLLKKYKIKAWVDAGVLLKYFRKQNIFPSSDIDFGIKSQDLKNILHFANKLKNKNYEVSTIGNFPLIFEGLKIRKTFSDDFVINIDIFIYYAVKNFLCRPNMHKPLKQDYFSVFVFIILNKCNKLKASRAFSNSAFPNYIVSQITFVLSWIYFRFAKTTQFAIPVEYLDKLVSCKINNDKFLMPKNIKQYIIWRYGPKWKVPNKKWRLTDGSMVFLNNLKVFWQYYIEAKKFESIAIFAKSNKQKSYSLFKFSDNEIIKIKKSTIKSQLF